MAGLANRHIDHIRSVGGHIQKGAQTGPRRNREVREPLGKIHNCLNLRDHFAPLCPKLA